MKMNPNRCDLSGSEIEAVLSYNPETGCFFRKRGASASTPAGFVHRTGYVVVKIRSKPYFAHRLAWIYMHGECPGEKFVDHINRDKSDNRIANLRLATQAENLANSSARRGSRFKGVQFDKRKKSGRKWFAVIRVDTKEKYLGCFKTAEEAAAAYRVAAINAWGEFACSGDVA